MMPIDYRRYPSNWKTDIVPTILARAQNKCEVCGLQNGTSVKSVPIQIKDADGRYKIKKLWVSNNSDLQRISSVSRGKTKDVRVVLTIAHLDHDEENHAVKYDRLKAMCQWCHLNYDAKEKYRRKCNYRTEEKMESK